MKKKGLWLGVACFACATLFGRDILVTALVKAYLSSKQSLYKIGEISSSGNRLEIRDLQADDVYVRNLQSEFHLQLFPLKLKAEVNVTCLTLHPSDESSHSLNLFDICMHPLVDVQLTVKEGQIIYDEHLLAFSVEPGNKKELLGTILIGEKDEIFLTNHLSRLGSSFISELNIHEGKIEDLIPLCSLISKELGSSFQQAKGMIRGFGKIVYDLKHGTQLIEGNVNLEHFFLEREDFAVKTDSLQGTVCFIPQNKGHLLENIELFLTFESLNLRLDQKLSFLDLLGEVRLSPGSDPYLKVHGNLQSQESQVAFETMGKGQLLEGGNYWLEASTDFFMKDRSSHTELSFCQSDEKIHTLQFETDGVYPEIASFFSSYVPNISMSEGVLTGKCLVLFEDGILRRIEINEGKASLLKCRVDKTEIAVDLLEGHLIALSNSSKTWIEFFEGKASKVAVSPDLFAKKIETQIAQGELVSATFEGEYQEITLAGHMLQPGMIHIEGKGEVDFFKAPVSMSIDLDEEKISWKAHLYEEEIRGQIVFKHPISYNLDQIFSKNNYELDYGTFEMETLSLQNFSFLKTEDLISSLEGAAKISGRFTQEKISTEIQDVKLMIGITPWVLGFRIDKLELDYDLQKRAWFGEIPIASARIESKVHKIAIEEIRGTFFCEENLLWSDCCTAKFLDVPFKSSLLLDHDGIHIATKKQSFAFKTLAPWLDRFAPEIHKAKIDGELHLNHESVLVDVDFQGNLKWKAELYLDHITAQLKQFGNIEEGKLLWKGDSLGNFSLKQVEGRYNSKHHSCQIGMQDMVVLRHKPVDFSFFAKDKHKEWALIEGSALFDRDGVSIKINPGAHLLGIAISVNPFTLYSKGSTSPIEFSSSLKLEHAPSYLLMWKEMGFSKLDPSVATDLGGTLELKGVYIPDKAHIETRFKVKSPVWKKQDLTHLQGVFKGKEGRCLLDECKIGLYDIKAYFTYHDEQIDCTKLTVTSLDQKFSVRGAYDFAKNSFSVSEFIGDARSFHVEGVFEGNLDKGKGAYKFTAHEGKWSIDSTKETKFLFSKEHGFVSDKLSCALYLDRELIGKLTSPKIYYDIDKKIGIAKEVALKLERSNTKQKELQQLNLTKQNFEMQGDVQYEQGIWKAAGFLKNGKYQLFDRSLDLKQTRILLEKGEVYLSSQVTLQNTPFYVQLYLGDKKAKVICKESLDDVGLALTFSKPHDWVVDSAQGSFSGLQIKAEKKGKEYLVDAGIDFSKIKSFVDQKTAEQITLYGLGAGYAFQGKVIVEKQGLYGIEGELRAKDFELLGQTFAKMQASISFREGSGKCKGLSIEDETMMLSLKSAEFTKQETDFTVNVPQIFIKHFYPARLSNGKKGVEIRNLSIFDVQGRTKDIKSFKGKGSLYFKAEEKKEFSLWDIPLTLMKDFGLDPGILTPTIGEADFTIQQGKIYFVSLKNVFSEGNRSQFDLADPGTDCYLGLDGAWHIDLKMKQNVVVKLTEDFILSIRGNLKKPKYSLKRNKN